MGALKRALAVGLVLWTCGGVALPARARTHQTYTQRVTMTYFLPTGNLTASGTVPTQGRTVGCLASYIGATATMPNGDVFLCEDTGLVYTPWIDFFAWSNADGQALVNTYATDCPSMCYSTVTFSFGDR